MTQFMKLLLAGTITGMAMLAAAIGTAAAAGPESRITILYDAFGKDTAMRKDWGFSALVEIAGKRILFDTGDNRDIFAANVKAKNVDLTKLDFVVLSHRHAIKKLNHRNQARSNVFGVKNVGLVRGNN